jgi:hypothetical protein
MDLFIVASEEECAMGDRELNQPHAGDKRYQRRDENGQWSDSDDQTDSLRQDVKQHAATKKPRNQGDKGD